MFDRLGSIISSYLDEDGESMFSKGNVAHKNTDTRHNTEAENSDAFDAYKRFNGKRRTAGNTNQRVPPQKQKEESPFLKVPVELYKDFIRLGLAPGTPFELCKSAYKNLLKKHHPDKHASNPFAVNRATSISATINASYQRIQIWYQTGTIEQ